MDVAFNRDDGLKGLAVVRSCLTAFKELRPLYFVLKACLKFRNLDSTFNGGISSFLLVNMIVYYLQTIYKMKTVTNKSLDEHLLDFFELFAY